MWTTLQGKQGVNESEVWHGKNNFDSRRCLQYCGRAYGCIVKHWNMKLDRAKTRGGAIKLACTASGIKTGKLGFGKDLATGGTSV